jgi:hypothetical protein
MRARPAAGFVDDRATPTVSAGLVISWRRTSDPFKRLTLDNDNLSSNQAGARRDPDSQPSLSSWRLALPESESKTWRRAAKIFPLLSTPSSKVKLKGVLPYVYVAAAADSPDATETGQSCLPAATWQCWKSGSSSPSPWLSSASPCGWKEAALSFYRPACTKTIYRNTSECFITIADIKIGGYFW